MNNEAQEIAVLRDALTRCVRASDRRLRTLPAAWGPTSSRIVQSNPRKCKPIVEQLVRDLEEGFRREEEEKLQKRKAESANQEPPNKRQRKETKPPKSENEADAQLRREFEIEDGDLDDENSNFCLQQLEDYGLPAEFKEKALDKLMSKVLAKLRLFSLLPRVVRFLKNRRAQRDNSSLPVIAKEVDLLQLLRSLYAAEPTEGARKIHRIFAQIQFNKAIQKQVKEARETRPASTSIINHIDALKLLVDKEAGDVDDEEKRTRLGWAKREYAAGETWAHIIKTFGGPGIVFLFILAKIYTTNIVRKSSNYQRTCLWHIAASLPFLKRIVKMFGSDCLDKLCQEGCLDESVIKDLESLDMKAEMKRVGCWNPSFGVEGEDSDSNEDDLDGEE